MNMMVMASYAKCKIATWLQKTFKDESGAAEVVATLVIIGIALALALIFREKLGNLVKDLWNKVVANTNPSGKVVPETWA